MTRAYARYEQTVDTSAGDRQDVVLYRDAACTSRLARFYWYNSRKPNSRTINTNINGTSYEVFWTE